MRIYDDVKIFEKYSGGIIDPVELLLLYSSRMTLLPELYDALGREYALRFLDIFSGRTISIPSQEAMNRDLRDVAIFLRIHKNDTPERRKEIAQKYDITLENLDRIYKAVNDVVSNVAKFKFNG